MTSFRYSRQMIYVLNIATFIKNNSQSEYYSSCIPLGNVPGHVTCGHECTLLRTAQYVMAYITIIICKYPVLPQPSQPRREVQIIRSYYQVSHDMDFTSSWGSGLSSENTFKIIILHWQFSHHFSCMNCTYYLLCVD